MYTHPKFVDVKLEVIKSFFIPEKNQYSLKIRWWHRKGWPLSNPYRIRLDKSKWMEFKPILNLSNVWRDI
jgi:hypothetical protein